MNFLLALLMGLFKKKETPVVRNAVGLDSTVPSFEFQKYIQLRNRLLRTYLEFNQEMIKAKGNHMDEIATYWSGTTLSITQVLQTTFTQNKDEDIKESLKLFEIEIKKVIDSLPSFGDGDGSGSINYTGPKGEA